MSQNNILPCQQALLLLFNLIPSKATGMSGIMLNAMKAQLPTIKKALEHDPQLQVELDSAFILARDELIRIYPIQKDINEK